jgi:hypothetical protein
MWNELGLAHFDALPHVFLESLQKYLEPDASNIQGISKLASQL